MQTIELLLHVIIGIFAFLLCWVVLIPVNAATRRVRLIGALLVGIGVALWMLVSGVSAAVYCLVLIGAELSLIAHMRSLEKKHAAENIFFQAAGAISGARARQGK